MGLGSICFIYILVTIGYSLAPEEYRPSTWWGWLAFVLLTIFCTPVVSLPASILACKFYG